VRIAFALSNASRVYAASLAGLYRSNDGGQSFARLSTLGLGSIAVDPLNPDVLYVGTWSDNRGVFKSTNGGLTLVETGQRGNFSALAIDPQHPDIIYAGLRFGAVLRSLDGAGTFTPASQGLSGDRVLGLGVDPELPTRLLVWMHAGGLFRSDDGADSWTAVDNGETLRRSTAQAGSTALVIDPRDPERVFLGNSSVLQVGIDQ
jgi:photosystem II stability/assembly factor-like uncharacterized protein